MRLSVPDHPRKPPRPLSDHERTGLLRAADVLMPESGDAPRASDAPGIGVWLDRALAARDDIFDEVTAAGATLARVDADDIDAAVRAMARDEPVLFGKVSTVLAGAYLLVPSVRRAIGYPGQERRYPAFDEAAEQILSGILDSVIERGTICAGLSVE